jgi:ubiquinone/menaquinone biosynthesis C-methylase UbiE
MNKDEPSDKNLDKDVMGSFSQEWKKYNYMSSKYNSDLDSQFIAYTSPIDLTIFDNRTSKAADFGAGSGRWTSRILNHFSLVFAVEPSQGAFDVLREKFMSESKVIVLKESIGMNSIPDSSLDFAMSLGVLHHMPDTNQGLTDISRKIKPGGSFLCYLYYSLDDKSSFYKFLFGVSSLVRKVISRLPYGFRRVLSGLIALTVYLPLARLSKYAQTQGRDVSNFPLHHYADMPYIMMQNDALDRFGTRLERRFSKNAIAQMLEKSDFDLSTLKFSKLEPFWTFAVNKNVGVRDESLAPIWS